MTLVVTVGAAPIAAKALLARSVTRAGEPTVSAKTRVVVHWRSYLRGCFCAVGIALLASQTAAAKCDVTVPNGLSSSGGRESPRHHASRYQLGTVLPETGTLIGRPSLPGRPSRGVDLAPDGSISTKFPWWGGKKAGRRLKIKGKRLDGPSEPLRAGIIQPEDDYLRNRRFFFWATCLTFPVPGCWRVNASAGSRAKLEFVVLVVAEA